MLTHIKKGLVYTLLFGSTLSLCSWILSRHDISTSQSTHIWALGLPSIAKAGFPLQAIEIPQPPLGNDWIPSSMLHGVLLNELFWISVGLVLALIFIRRFPVNAQAWTTKSLTIGTIAVFLHIALMMLWFD